MNWIDPELALERCSGFLRTTLAAAGCHNLVVGLSGGIDSAVSAGIAVHALGPDRVCGVMMPYRTSSAASQTDAVAVAATLGCTVEKVEITTMAEAFLAAAGTDDRLRSGNIMARCRMIVLYDRSARDHALVLGTGNRTESLLGYTTMYGDNACGLNPLGELYKTEIRALAAFLDLPEAVMTKVPSADLWAGQSDEDELGISYAEVDRLLVRMVDEGLGTAQLIALGFARELVAKIQVRVRTTAFKRTSPPVCAFPGRLDPDTHSAAPAAFGDKDGGFH